MEVVAFSCRYTLVKLEVGGLLIGGVYVKKGNNTTKDQTTEDIFLFVLM